MHTTWIVAADSYRARIFEMKDAGGNLEEIEDFANPAARTEKRGLETDAEGHFFQKGSEQAGHTDDPAADAEEHAAELFSRELSRYLDLARGQHRYDKLQLIAYPKFLGLLRQNLSKDAQRLVDREISKDISWFDGQDMTEYIRKNFH